MSSQPPTKEELETRLATALAEVDGLREQLGSAQGDSEIRLFRAKLNEFDTAEKFRPNPNNS